MVTHWLTASEEILETLEDKTAPVVCLLLILSLCGSVWGCNSSLFWLSTKLAITFSISHNYLLCFHQLFWTSVSPSVSVQCSAEQRTAQSHQHFVCLLLSCICVATLQCCSVAVLSHSHQDPSESDALLSCTRSTPDIYVSHMLVTECVPLPHWTLGGRGVALMRLKVEY